MQIVWSKDMISRLLTYHGALLREALQGEKDYARMKQTLLFTQHTRIYCIELPKVTADKMMGLMTILMMDSKTDPMLH